MTAFRITSKMTWLTFNMKARKLLKNIYCRTTKISGKD